MDLSQLSDNTEKYELSLLRTMRRELLIPEAIIQYEVIKDNFHELGKILTQVKYLSNDGAIGRITTFGIQPICGQSLP